MSEELRGCPFCGGAAEVVPAAIDRRYYQVRCRTCFSAGGQYADANRAMETWNRRAEEANPALTLEELRGMEEEPLKHWVWIENSLQPDESAYMRTHADYSHGRKFCCGWPGMSWAFGYDDYGKTWLAYRRKPKEGAG